MNDFIYFEESWNDPFVKKEEKSNTGSEETLDK
jgi:hypothetical protein